MENRLGVSFGISCDCDARIALDASEGRVRLQLESAFLVRIEVEAPDLEGVLRGEPIQWSAQGSFCHLERVGHRIHLEYGFDGEHDHRCEFSETHLADALAWAREQMSVEFAMPHDETAP